MSSPRTLLSLPSELHLAIASHLPYPDLLALKHTHPHFYTTIRTTVYDRVDWLLERPRQGLPLPQTKCIMKTDAQFCSNGEIRKFMRRRRRHLDCKVGRLGCRVVEGSTCVVSRMRRGREKSKGRRRVTMMGMVVVGLLAMLIMRVMSCGSHVVRMVGAVQASGGRENVVSQLHIT